MNETGHKRTRFTLAIVFLTYIYRCYRVIMSFFIVFFVFYLLSGIMYCVLSTFQCETKSYLYVNYVFLLLCRF